MPMLLAVVVIKYISILVNRFRTKKTLFYWNMSGYFLFLTVAALIEYKNKMA